MPDFKSHVPAHVLLLHTPWLYDGTGFVGTLKLGTRSGWTEWTQCTPWTEYEGICPKVCDHFLSWALGAKLKGDYKLPELGNHCHDLTHGHKIDIAGNADRTIAEFERDGPHETVVADHSHAGTVKDAVLKTLMVTDDVIDTSMPADDTEPLHCEVAAYYTGGAAGEIPPGTVVFSDRQQVGAPGWHSLAADGLPQGQTAATEPWRNILLKVVGCVPENRFKGSVVHRHTVPAHTHSGGNVLPADPTYRRKLDKHQSGMDSSCTRTDHTHPVDDVSLVGDGFTNYAESLPRSQLHQLFISTDAGAEWQVGMILPFVAATAGQYDAMAQGQVDGWVLYEKPERDDDQLFLCSHDDDLLATAGKAAHDHRFSHTHYVTLGDSMPKETIQGDIANDASDNIWVAEGLHQHKNLPVTEHVPSSPAPNVLMAREVNFIIFDGLAASER